MLNSSCMNACIKTGDTQQWFFIIFIHKQLLFRYTKRKIHASLARQKQKWDKSCSSYVQKERLCLRDFLCYSLLLNLVKHLQLHLSPIFFSTSPVDLCCFPTTEGIPKRFLMRLEKRWVNWFISQHCHLKIGTQKMQRSHSNFSRCSHEWKCQRKWAFGNMTLNGNIRTMLCVSITQFSNEG